MISDRFNFPGILVIVPDWTSPLPFLVSFPLCLLYVAAIIISPSFVLFCFFKSLGPYAVIHEKMTAPLHYWGFQRCFNGRIRLPNTSHSLFPKHVGF